MYKKKSEDYWSDEEKIKKHREKMKIVNKKTWEKPGYRENYKKTAGKIISKKLKDKIANGEWTPNITNFWCKTLIEYKIDKKIYKFRSAWEAVFFILNKDKNLQYEKIRIPYIFENKTHNYISDFFDEKNKIIYEIKPSRKLTKKENEKLKQAEIWCKKRKISFMLISNIWFKENAKNINYKIYPQLYKKMVQFL